MDERDSQFTLRSQANPLGLLLFLLFVLLRFGADEFWRSRPIEYSYAFEVVFILSTLYLYKEQFVRPHTSFKKEVLTLLMALLFGGAVSFLGDFLDIVSPFQQLGLFQVVSLIFIAPILEEALFRWALWEPLRDLTKTSSTPLVVTSLLFSFSHLIAWWYVPEILQAFILYQAIYTFLLGLACGLARESSKNPITAITLHFGFNLAFFLKTLL